MKNKKLLLLFSILLFAGCSDKYTLTSQAKCYYPTLPTSIQKPSDINVSVWKYDGNDSKSYIVVPEDDFIKLSASYKEVKEKLKVLLDNISEFNKKIEDLNSKDINSTIQK
jgi:uncharacterized lipoprotein YajG